jgi:hypothetical protein
MAVLLFSGETSLPLKPNHNIPVFVSSSENADRGSAVGLNWDGRISFLPVPFSTTVKSVELNGSPIIDFETNAVLVEETMTIPLVSSIHNLINTRFPMNKDIYGNTVNQYLVAAVYYFKENGPGVFIFEVWGFRTYFKELDDLYYKLLSLGGCRVGDERYAAIKEYLSSDPVKQWINELIVFLKKELDWANFVKKCIDHALYNE